MFALSSITSHEVSDFQGENVSTSEKNTSKKFDEENLQNDSNQECNELLYNELDTETNSGINFNILLNWNNDKNSS